MSETELLFTILGTASVILMLARQELGFHLLILVVPFASLFPESSIPGLNMTTAIVYTAMVVAIFTSPKRERSPALLKGPIVILIGVTLASIVWSTLTVPGYSFIIQLARAKRWFDFMLLYFVFRHIADDSEAIRKYARTLFIGYALVVLHVAKEFLTTDHARLYGVISQTNELGAFLAAYWGLCVLMFLEKRNLRRLVSGGIIGFLALLGLVYTFSRGGYLAFVSALLVLMIYLNRKLAVAAVVGAVCLFSVVGLGLLPEAAAKRIQTAYEVDSSGDIELRETAASRMLLNKAAINIIRDHPIVGTGWGCLFIKGQDRFLEAGTDGTHVVHNMYLRIFSTLGILGFVPFMLIFWFSFVEGRRLYKRAPPGYFRYFAAVFLACLAAFAVSNLFGNRMFSGLTTGYFWIMCALVERSLALVSGTEVVTESDGTEKSVREPLDGWMTTQ